ncbi:MAG: methyltransferase [Alphaproteobacteria bacterium]
MLKQALLAALAGFALSGAASAADMSAKVPDYIAAAISDSGRPDTDKARDANRKPADMMVFAGVKPGMKVLEFMPAGGYFLRIFSKAIGPGGKLFEVVPPPPPPGAQVPPDAKTRMDAFNEMVKGYTNVTAISTPFDSFTVPEKVDLAWTSQNYHDFHGPFFKMDIAKFNKAVFDALKPGGIYIVLDHAAAPGAGVSVVSTLHRIEESTVKSEVEAAGFRLVAESDVLRNPADPHTAIVFDPSIRGKTDQFILKFQKP